MSIINPTKRMYFSVAYANEVTAFIGRWVDGIGRKVVATVELVSFDLQPNH